MKWLLLAGVALPGFIAAAPALAATPDPGAADTNRVQEVVVTAERRESTVQKTPAAVTALTGAFLKRADIANVEDVSHIAAGLTLNRTSNFVQLNIRGVSYEQINLGGEPGVALHIDGVYIARPFADDAVFADLARVEVVRGPQGTLYGRNATGGSVNLITNEPSATPGGEMAMSYGNYNHLHLEGMFNTPLDPNGVWRLRVSGVTDDHDGYATNLLTGQKLDDGHVQAIRAGLAYDPGTHFDALIRADYSHEADTGPIYLPGIDGGTALLLGGRAPLNPREVYSDGPHANRFETWGVSARLRWDLGDAKLTSLTAYRDTRFRLQTDLDGTDFFLVNENLAEAAQQVSEELQLASQGQSRFRWIGGLYFFHETGDLDYFFAVPPLGTNIQFLAGQTTTSYAAFGEATYDMMPRLHLTVGARYTYDQKSYHEADTSFGATATNALSHSWPAFTPKFNLSYDIDDSKMAYATISRGFKAGGFNIGGLQRTPYDPEYVWSYEGGLKSRWFDDRLQVNLAAFHYDYTDLQVEQYALARSFINNAASAKVNGVEAEIIAKPVDHLTVNASLAYVDATFSNYMTTDSFRPTLGLLNLDGNTLPRAPKLTFSVGGEYDIPLPNTAHLGLEAEIYGRSKVYFTPFDTANAVDGGYATSNARVSYGPDSGRWEIALYGKNLTDRATPEGITVSAINGGSIVTYGPPRTYGAELRVRF